VAVITLRDEAAAAPLGAQIRDALAEGRVAEAAQHLTYEYALSAEVVGGDRRGRLLGFPTANLRVDANKLLPANGIYAVRVGLPGDPCASRPAVASVGVRPTFGDHNARLVEVHLLDLSMDLYGVRITTTFVEWLRSEERFDTVEALIRQMSEDVAQARMRLGTILQASESGEGPLRPQVMHQGDAHP
jgi:riboflavin kinase/FMN adenylyltransferase